MQLHIHHEDEAGFERARDWLVGDFGRWLRAERRLEDELADIAAGDAGILLDWKFGYGDGHLGRWTCAEVTEFLMRWCPRKLSVSQERSVTIPGSLAAFTDYLAARARLAPGSSSGAALREAVTSVSADFVTEMGNPANFGMAKSFLADAAARGYDLADEDSLASWAAELNSLGDSLGDDERYAVPVLPPVPPVVMPAEAEIEASRAGAPVLAMFAGLAQFAGAGRGLTQSGNLTLKDARELVRLLGTGDSMEERFGDEVIRTRSSQDLPVLRLVFAWARKAGVVRVRQGKVLATKRGLALARSPASMFDRALDVLLEAGPVTLQRHPRSWAFWPDIDGAIDQMVLPMLIRPYLQRSPVRLAELTEEVAKAILQAFDFGSLPDDTVAGHVGWKIAAAMDVLALAGVVRWSAMPGGDHEPAARRPDGAVEITPAGMAAVRRRLIAAGFDAPVAGRWADASAEELLAGADRDDLISFFAELDAWRRRRSPEQALAELAAAVRHATDPSLQNIALTVMADIGPELAAPHVRELAGERPAVRGFALCWLADHRMLDARELYDPADPESFAYVLSHRLVTGGSDALLACLAGVGGEAAQVQVVGDLGRLAVPPAGAVLETIGRDHPANAVAKAARKALFIMRSRYPRPET